MLDLNRFLNATQSAISAEKQKRADNRQQVRGIIETILADESIADWLLIGDHTDITISLDNANIVVHFYGFKSSGMGATRERRFETTAWRSDVEYVLQELVKQINSELDQFYHAEEKVVNGTIQVVIEASENWHEHWTEYIQCED